MTHAALHIARVFALVAMALTCAATRTPVLAFDDGALARRMYDNVILPGYARFDDSARDFVKVADALCEKPSPAALVAARDQARATLLAWGRIEPLRFGPIVEKQRSERLLFYPDPHNIVERQTRRLLAKHDEADITPEKLAAASVAVQGFGALDAVLYGRGSQALADATPVAAFRCRYLRTLAAGIAQIAADTHAAWAGEFGRAWLQPGVGNKTYLTKQETTQALYRAYVTELEVLRAQRLEPLLGGKEKTPTPPTPLLVHSGLGLQFILAAVEGERDILGPNGFLGDGLASSDTERAAVPLLAAAATDLGFAARAGTAAAAMAGDAFANPQARARLMPMQLSLKNAEEVGRSALADLTGLALGFNALDGD